MIDYDTSDSGLVEITIAGDISRADVQDVTAMLERAAEARGFVRVLQVVKSIGDMEPSLFADEIEFSLRRVQGRGRAALVICEPWMEMLGDLVRPFVGGNIRVFELDEIGEARAWLMGD